MRKVEGTLTMPPTSNNIYIKRPGGGRMLSSEARTWRTRSVKELTRQANLGFLKALDPNQMYFLVLHFYFERVINKGWNEFYTRGIKKGQRKAETKWKKIDTSNRVKLAEDTVKIVTGVDDCATFFHVLIKDCDPENPRLEITLAEVAGRAQWNIDLKPS